MSPTIANLQGDTIFYTEGAAPSRIDAGSNATIGDTDTFTFAGGYLSARISTNNVPSEDVLGISTSGGVSLSGSLAVGATVFVGATAIGTVSSNGAGGTAPTGELNASATQANVTTLLRAITYSNTNLANPSIAPRTILTLFGDGDIDSTDAEAFSTVTVVSVGDAPVAVAGGGTASYTEGAPVAVDAGSWFRMSIRPI